MLNENVKKYADLQAQKEALEAEMAELKTAIVEEMGSDTDFTADDGTVAKLVDKETFKYTDEIAMINWCKMNGYSQFIVEKVNTTSMNKELKKGLTLTESLKPMFTKTVSTSLTVKRA